MTRARRVGFLLSILFLASTGLTLASHSADLSGDGQVDQADLNVLTSQWQATGTADLNHDGMVSFADAGFLFSSWGSSCDFYVAPSGTSSGNGSLTNPWDLTTAFNHPSALQPGDTICLRGGTYPGTFTISLAGTAGAPIVVRSYPGEWAVIDGSRAGLTPKGINIINASSGGYFWFRDFEITNTDPERVITITGSNPPERRGAALNIRVPGVKIINMVIHDAAESGTWSGATDFEAYGNIVYYNGWDAPDRGHGPGLYVQNQTTTKFITDNIIFQNMGGNGIQAYTEGGYLNNIYVEGNIVFNNGEMSATTGFSRNIEVGGLRVAENPTLLNNFTYFPGTKGVNIELGYNAGCTNPTVRDNYFAGAMAIRMTNCTGTITMTGNTFYGIISGFTAATYPNNTYFPSTTRPTGVAILLRPNAYDSRRAHLAIFNWDLKTSVTVDVSNFLKVGETYEVKNAQNYFGPPVASGTYSGGTISIPMNLSTIATPVGNVPVQPTPTTPEFGAFVLIKK